MQNNNNDIEKMFNSECRDKKRIGIGVYKRASRRGYIRGGVKTAYDFLSTKEKKRLNGEIKMSNKYEDINNVPNYEKFKLLDDDSARNIMLALDRYHTSDEVLKYWGINRSAYYKARQRYNVTRVYKNSKRTKSNNSVNINRDIPTLEEYREIEKKSIVNPNDKLEELRVEISNMISSLSENIKDKNDKLSAGFSINFTGEYSKEEVENRLLNIAGVMIKDKRYRVSINLEEIE